MSTSRAARTIVGPSTLSANTGRYLGRTEAQSLPAFVTKLSPAARSAGWRPPLFSYGAITAKLEITTAKAVTNSKPRNSSGRRAGAGLVLGARRGAGRGRDLLSCPGQLCSAWWGRHDRNHSRAQAPLVTGSRSCL